MSTKLLLQWLEDGAEDRRARQKAASDAFERMSDKTTAYALAIRVLSIIHGEAAHVYESELRRQQGPR